MKEDRKSKKKSDLKYRELKFTASYWLENRISVILFEFRPILMTLVMIIESNKV